MELYGHDDINSGVVVGVKVISQERFVEKIPGWVFNKRTKKTKDDSVVYFTYYSSCNHIQDFLDRITKNKEWRKQVIVVHQVDPDNYETFDDPKRWPYKVRVWSTEPFDEEFEGCEITRGPILMAGGAGLWVTVYQSKDKFWNDFKETIESDPELRYIVTDLHYDTELQIDIYKRAKNERYFKTHSRKKHITIVKGGGFKKTKYEYPTDCTSKSDRSRYRRTMRKKNK